MTMTKATTECDEKLVGWSDAWETCCRRFVEDRMGVLEDELMIQ